MASKVSAAFLVPRRADHGPRDAIWKYVKRFWSETLANIPIVEGHDSGVGHFNRSEAMNAARAAAPDVDVLVILDADVIADKRQALRAISRANREQSLVIGYSRWNYLSASGTKQVMRGYKGDWRPFIETTYTDNVSSLVAVSAEVWDRVGGFDERFNGWGYEDSAFEVACDTLAKSSRIEGDLWHLWHPTSIDHHRRVANKKLYKEYQMASRDPEAMEALIRSRNESSDSSSP